MDQNRYIPPESDIDENPDLVEDFQKCPYCGGSLVRGFIESSSAVTWRNEDVKGMKWFTKSSDRIGQTASGLGAKYSALRCESCKVYIVTC